MPADASGVIHDLGYQRYDGGRLGRAQIVRTLTAYSLRAAFGLGRGARAKILPVSAFALMCAPAIVNAAIVARGGTRAFPYDTYSPPVRTIVMIIFVAAQAPELVSRDLRSRVLPLYFARPLRRADYPVAKFTALATICLSVATTRALALGLFYVLLWEGALANFVGGARILSAGHYALALANEVARDRALNPGVNLTTAVAMGSIVTVLALAVAVRKLASFSLRGDAA